MQLELSPHSIPNFLTHATPLGLRRLMLINNAKMGGFVRYFDLGQVKLNDRLVFIAWFYSPVSRAEELDQLLPGGKS